MDPGTDTVSDVRVEWGDGATPTGWRRRQDARLRRRPGRPDDHGRIADEDGTFLDQANAFSVTVNNVEPTLTVSGAAAVNEGSLYSLTLGSVVDPGTDTVTNIRVNWGDGTFSDGAGVGVRTHTYADGLAVRTITVDITDEDGTFLDQANALVGARSPMRILHTRRRSTRGGSEGALETFGLGSFSDAGVNDDPWTIEVDWGDGSAVESFDLNVQGDDWHAAPHVRRRRHLHRHRHGDRQRRWG